MDDNNSSPSTSTADRLNSFHPECNNLKQQYDQCFNAWFTDHYMNGHYNNVECQKLFEIYTDCVKEEDERLLQLENSLDIELKELQEKKKKRDAIMKALHHYNDIKDTTQMILGQLAILEGVTVAEIHLKYNLLESD